MGTAWISRRAEAKNRARNGGVYRCLACSRRALFSGRANPNARHMTVDDRLMETIDSEAKAYLLGWIASDGSVRKGTITVQIYERDRLVLGKIQQQLGLDVPLRPVRDQVAFSLNSQQIVRDVCRHLGIVPGRRATRSGLRGWKRGRCNGPSCAAFSTATGTSPL